MVAISKSVIDCFDLHQQKAYEKLIAEQGGIVWMRVGDGKTRPALFAAIQIARDGKYPLIIVIARRKAFYDWRNEIATLQLDADVYEIEQVAIPFLKTITKTTFVLVSEGKTISAITQQSIYDLHFNNSIGCIILDEGWLYKNPKSLKHQAVIQYTKLHPTILLSGSIMTARDIVDIYGQVTAAGKGNALALTLSKFRQEFQTGIGGQYMSWYPKPGAYKAIMSKIEPFTYIYMPKRDVRETKTIIRKVPASDRQLDLFKELKETAAVEGMFELSNVANITTKAQQISNGWLKGDNGQLEYFDSPKIERLLGLIDEILIEDKTNKVVVWCAFREDILRITQALNCSGLDNQAVGKIATLQSGTTFDRTLWKRPDCRICLATEASGISINDFAQVPYGIYFSQDFKWFHLQQSQGRHTRRSSLHPTAYFTFLHTEKSLDAQVYYTVKHAASSELSFIKQMDILQWLKEK